jgi:hypothetical protein
MYRNLEHECHYILGTFLNQLMKFEIERTIFEQYKNAASCRDHHHINRKTENFVDYT